MILHNPFSNPSSHLDGVQTRQEWALKVPSYQASERHNLKVPNQRRVVKTEANQAPGFLSKCHTTPADKWLCRQTLRSSLSLWSYRDLFLSFPVTILLPKKGETLGKHSFPLASWLFAQICTGTYAPPRPTSCQHDGTLPLASELVRAVLWEGWPARRELGGSPVCPPHRLGRSSLPSHILSFSAFQGGPMRIPLGSVIGQGVLWKVCPLLALQKRFK